MIAMSSKTFSPLLLLACSSILTAAWNDSAEPTCLRLSSDDVHFNLSGTGMTRIKKSFMTSEAVTCAYLARNNISELEIGAFDGLPNLRYLNLVGNPIAFGDFARMNLPSLRSLVFDGPSDHDGLAGAEANSTLNADNNEIRDNFHNHGHKSKKRLFTDFPMPLPSLRKVSFSHYQDPLVVKRLNYMKAPNLTHLCITSNRIREIRLPQNVTETLTHLSADDNGMERFAVTLPKLRYPSMNGNRVRKLCLEHCSWNAIALSALPTLKHHSLAYNGLTHIEDDTFDNSTELRSLNFTGNEIASLPENLTSCAKLRSLVLSPNNLTEVFDVRRFAELELLHLADNRIAAIDGTTFSNSTQLRSVDLRGNEPKSIPAGTFADLPALTELNLSGNRLTKFAPNWIESANGLVTVRLDGKSFHDVEDMALDFSKKLTKLPIRKNPLKAITVRTVALLPPDTQIKVLGR